MLVLTRKNAPISVEVVALDMQFSGGYTIRPGGEPEKKGDPIFHEIVGKGWSVWVRCTQKVTVNGAVGIKVQTRSAKTAKKGLAFAPHALLAVDVDGDGKWQKVGEPISTAFGDSDDDAETPAPTNGEIAAKTPATPLGGAKA